MANWPDNLVEIMSHDNPDFIRTVNISIWLAPDVKDVTRDARKKGQFLRYAPDIRQIGLGLLRERRGETWGDQLVRALEANESKIRKRCLQYIYVWTKQKSAVSFLQSETIISLNDSNDLNKCLESTGNMNIRIITTKSVRIRS